MLASIAYHMPAAAEAGGCCREPTLAVPRHENADEDSARRPVDEHRPNRAADHCLLASSALWWRRRTIAGHTSCPHGQWRRPRASWASRVGFNRRAEVAALRPPPPPDPIPPRD